MTTNGVSHICMACKGKVVRDSRTRTGWKHVFNSGHNSLYKCKESPPWRIQHLGGQNAGATYIKREGEKDFPSD